MNQEKNKIITPKISAVMCPVCHHHGWTFFTKRNDGFSVYKCSFCHLYINEGFKKKILYSYEKKYFINKTNTTNIGYGDYEKNPEFNFFWQFALLKLFAPKIKTVLDLGSGTGKFLEILRIEGFKGYGIDISRFATRIAKEKGLAVKTLDLEEENIPFGNYDVITAWDLLEHLTNPLEFLQQIKKLIHNSNIFIFTTPRADYRNKNWFNYSLDHKLYFTEKSLRFLINKVFSKNEFSYELIKINFGGKTSGLLSSFIGIVQKHKKINKKLIQLIESRRLTGKKEIDNYLKTIFVHFFQDSEKDRFFKTKGILGTLFNLSLKYYSGKWVPADLNLFISHNPYLKSYQNSCLSVLYQSAEKKLISKEKEISSIKKEVNGIKQEYSVKLNKIYQSKTWRLLKFYQVWEQRFENLNQKYFWQNLLQNLNKEIISHLLPLNLKQAYTFDVLYFPIIDWYFRYQRPQQICTQLAKNGHRIFYIKPSFIVINDKNLTKKQIVNKISIFKINPNIFEVSVVISQPLNIYRDTISSLDQKYITWSLEVIREKMQIRNKLAIVALPFWYPLLNNRWKIIYDCMDEHSGFTNISQKVILEEHKLIRRADLITYSSHQLMAKNKKLNSKYLLIKNASDFNYFSQKSKIIPTDLKTLKHPLIGYYGAIADWFDDQLVEHLVLKRPQWQFIFIGHIMSPQIYALKKLANVHFLGEKPYQALSSYLCKFDCFIIPFKLNKLILATNPVKAYEVLASGKPIVSVNLPELKPMKKLLYLAKNKVEFLAKIEKALAEKQLPLTKKKNLINQRIKFAKQNTWDKRANDLMEGINNYIYPKVSIIIVAYNTLFYLKKCLESIYKYSYYPNLEIIVVDNNSLDGTKKYLTDFHHKDVNLRIILNTKNLGFASANNVGIQQAKGKYLILLNADTIVTENWVMDLINYLKDPKIGLVGPITNCIGNEAKVDLEYQNLKQMHLEAKKYTQTYQSKSFTIPMLAFYCVAARKSLLDKIGPLDIQFKTGFFEDDDYCHRVKLAGYKIICAEDVFIHHYGNQSFKQLSFLDKKRVFGKNKKLFEKKWSIKWKSHKYRK